MISKIYLYKFLKSCSFWLFNHLNFFLEYTEGSHYHPVYMEEPLNWQNCYCVTINTQGMQNEHTYRLYYPGWLSFSLYIHIYSLIPFYSIIEKRREGTNPTDYLTHNIIQCQQYVFCYIHMYMYIVVKQCASFFFIFIYYNG